MATKKPLKLYTKTGDKGESNVLAGIRLPKHHPIFATLGTIDELNAAIGFVLVRIKRDESIGSRNIGVIGKELLSIQNHLLTCGALIAGSNKVSLEPKALTQLEKRIDYYQTHTADDWYTKFLLPGGTELAARIDLARTVCRRAERETNTYASTEKPELYTEPNALKSVQQYLNRLSDYLFALRCYVNSQAGYEEVTFN